MTEQQRLLSIKYLLYRVCTNAWFLGAVWLYFYRIYITDQQIGILDAMAFTIGLLAEIPSGALADKFGRDKMVRLGQFLVGSGLLVQAFGVEFFTFFIGQVIFMIGISFVSGADEALFFENLRFERTSTAWRKLITRGTQFALITSALAGITGGYLHSIDPRTPWILTATAFFMSVILIWSVKDTRQKKEYVGVAAEVRDYFKNINLGFRQFANSSLFVYVPIIVIIQGLFYATGFGLLRIILLDRFHFDPFLGSVVMASSSIITVGVLALMHRHAERLHEKQVITVISLSAIICLLFSIPDIGYWGYFVILILWAGEHTLFPFMSEILNIQSNEDQRATVLSIASFLKAAPYIALAPVIGYLNTHGELHYFLLLWPTVMLLALLFYLALRKQNVLVSVREVD